MKIVTLQTNHLTLQLTYIPPKGKRKIIDSKVPARRGNPFLSHHHLNLLKMRDNNITNILPNGEFNADFTLVSC